MSTANRQITDFYKKRFPAQDSQIAHRIRQAGRRQRGHHRCRRSIRQCVGRRDRAAASGGRCEADLSGNYVALAKFINALERDDMFFLISSIALAGEQKGPIKLQMKLANYLKAGA